MRLPREISASRVSEFLASYSSWNYGLPFDAICALGMRCLPSQAWDGSSG